jgi:hypothetical protein
MLACSLNALMLASAHAAKVIDQLQPNIDTDSILAIGGSSEQKLAQTITVGIAGILKGIYLPINCADGRLKIAINDVVDGAPGTFEYTYNQVRPARITNQITTFRYFGLPGNLAVEVGDEYAIVIDNATGSCGISGSPTGDTYAGGGGFFDARPNPPGWVQFEETESRFDLPFMLLIKTP